MEEQNEEIEKTVEENEEISEDVYEELFLFASSDNEVVKKESLRIILSLLEEKEFVDHIIKNNKKYLKTLISSLNSRCKLLTLECLLNLSAQLPKELTERNLIEILFDMMKEEEKIEENCIDLYIMIISNLTRCKEGVYKVLDINDDSNINIKEDNFKVSFFLNKLLYFFFLPIKPSINKNLSDKYIYVSHVLINISSIKESIVFFKNVAFLNKISDQILNVERFRAILPFIINLCLNEAIHVYIFHDDCYLFPYVLSYLYTNEYNITKNASYNNTNNNEDFNTQNIHHIIMNKSSILVPCSIIKSRILIILFYLCNRDYSREKLLSYGISDILKNWKSCEKNAEFIDDIENVTNKLIEASNPGEPIAT
ncbi:conserved Plasmodium protein, unknown function [Plasmodium sp. gorilla clade G2]|uniref:conserved Plasmodium protein, unknown function n=1 Tax=Plasmodium sp. gorilla clade G2 TaxID=880535 RepID=UPI000D213595|nr:conserved Plasmodium protein, unknown function [Plasmodium sp. gorilla clade G2]SOV19008.1 conserved Plasmodium protein, unknown function [Plasmodium sp. gorilla clade G2]